MDVASLTVKVVNEGLDTTAKGLDDLGKSAKDAAKEAEKSVSKFDKMKKSVDGFNKNMQGLRNAALVGGGAIVAMGASVLKTSGNFEAAMNGVKAVSGATGAQFDALRDKAKELGATTAFSASEAANGMEFLAMAGMNTEQILSTIPNALNLAAAGGLDLASSADILSNIMTGMGLAAEESGRAADVLAATAAGANVDIKMMGESMKYVAPIAKQLGISLEDTAAMVGVLGNAGIQGSEAGTALRAVYSRLATDNKAKAHFEALGIAIKDAEGKMRPMTDLLEDLGKATAGMNADDALKIYKDSVGAEAMSAFGVTIDSIADGSLNNLINKVKEAEGEAKRMADVRMEGFEGAMKGLSSAFEGLQIAIGDSGLLNIFTDLTNKFAEWVRELSAADPELFKMIGTFAAVGLAVSGFIVAASGMGMVAASIMALANPVGLTMIAISALIAVGGLLITNWDAIKAKATEVWSGVVNLVNDNKVAFAALSAVMASIVIGFIAVNAQAIASAAVFTTMRAATIAYNAVLAVTNGIMAAWAGAKFVASLAMIGARVVANTAIFVVHNTALVAMKAATLAWQAVLGVGKLIAMGAAVAANTVRLIAQTTALAAIRVATVAWSVASSAAAIGAKALGVAIRFMLGPIGIAITVIGALVAAGVYLYKNWDEVKAKATAIWNSVKETIINSLSGLPAKLLQAGKDAVNGLINGIKGKIADVKNAASELGQAAWGGVKSFLQIRSPSRKMAELGKHTADGMAKGIKDNAKVVKTEAQKMAEQAVETVKNSIASLKKEIALFGNDSPLASFEYDVKVGKYQGVSKSLLDQNRELIKQKQQLIDLDKQQTESARKLKAANDSIYNSIESMNRQLYEMGGERSPLEMLNWDLENTEKYANASADAIAALKDKTKELFEQQQAQAEAKRANEAAAGLAGVKGDLLGLNNNPVQRIVDEYERQLAVIAEYEQTHQDILKDSAEKQIEIERMKNMALQDMVLASGEIIAGNMSSIFKDMLGEQSKGYKAMFAIEKGFTIAKAAIAMQRNIAEAMSTGFPQNIPLIAGAVAQGSNIMSAIRSITMPVGQAHDGIMSVPKSGTWNLEKGERVLPAHTAKAMDRKLEQGGNTVVNVYIDGVKTQQTVDSNGDIRIQMQEVAKDTVKQSWGNLQNPNSYESKQVSRNVQAPRKRA